MTFQLYGSMILYKNMNLVFFLDIWWIMVAKNEFYQLVIFYILFY